MAYIYKITNLITGKSYIGETNRTIEARWYQHRYRAENEIRSEYLYRAMNKYGIENFIIEEIEQCKPEVRFERETYYILLYDTLAPNGYNLILSQNGPNFEKISRTKELWDNGLIITEIATALRSDPKSISLYLKGIGVTTEEIRKRKGSFIGKRSSKKVIRYDLKGNFIDEWDSASNAAKELNYNVASICKCCNGDLLTYKNYIWQWSNNDNIEEIVLLTNMKKKVGLNKKAIRCLDLNKTFIKEYPSASAAGRDLGVAHAGIAYAARNGTVSYGHYWEYIEKGKN